MILKLYIVLITLATIVGWVLAINLWQDNQRVWLERNKFAYTIGVMKEDAVQKDALIGAQNEKIKDLKWRNNVWMLFYGPEGFDQLLKIMVANELETTTEDINF